MNKTLACGALAALMLTGSALAQDLRGASENVVACQTVEDAAARLSCFETAAAELSSALAAPVPEPVAALPQPQVQTAPAETSAVASTTQVPQTAAPAAAPIQQASTEAPAEVEAPESSLPSWIPRITFGSDRDVEKEPDEFETQLTRIQVNKLGRHFFTTAEGHVWRQKSPEEIRAPKTLPADVVIYQNITGGLRLKIVETNRSYPVRRVE